MEDYYWNQRAMEAEKSGYVGADVLMALLDAGPDASEE
jgi:hypothetical protein